MRCEICQVDSESDAKYCRKCGKLLNTSPKHSAEELAADHNTPVEAVKSNSTSVIGVDFSNPSPPKKVEPLWQAGGSRQEGGSKTAQDRRWRRRRLRALLWPATGIVIQLAIAVATITLMWRYMPQPQQAHAPTPAEEAESSATENAIKEREKELDVKTRINEELDEKIAEKQQIIGKFDKESADKKRELKKLEKMLVNAKAELNEVTAETASAERRHDKLNREIARGERTLRASKKAIAQLAPKRVEVAQLNRKLKVLRTAVSQKEFIVRNLQRKVDLMTNANHASKNRRTPRKG